MDLIRCLLVDDEPPAIRLLEKYVNNVPFLELVATTTSSLEALSLIESKSIDLVFLDIQMPEFTGIQLSKIINNKIKIIFITAYPEYALESYKLNAVDYLLKPFEFERFYEAVLKVKNSSSSINIEVQTEAYLFVKTDGKNNFEKVFIKDIYYIEGLKNYVLLHLKDKKIITYNTLKGIEEELPKNEFIKIHKSFIVSFQHIDKTDSLSVYINNQSLPIGNTHKKKFFNVINENRL